MFDGQSLGLSPFISDQAYPAKFMTQKYPGTRYHVTNLTGTTYAERNADVGSRVDVLLSSSPHAVLIDDGGTYDIEDAHGDMTSAQLLAAKASYTAARRAAGADYIVGLTVAPSTQLTAGEETIRQEVNTALLASPMTYGYNKVVNLDAVPELSNANNATYYYDGTHWSDAATTKVKQALIDAGV